MTRKAKVLPPNEIIVYMDVKNSLEVSNYNEFHKIKYRHYGIYTAFAKRNSIYGPCINTKTNCQNHGFLFLEK
jgi:hypothetical protein